MALLFKHEPKAALAEIEQETSDPWRMIGLPLAYCGLGRKADAEQAITALIGKYAKGAPYNIAYDYAYCGEADQAFAWLDKAVQYQDRRPAMRSSGRSCSRKSKPTRAGWRSCARSARRRSSWRRSSSA